MQSTERRKKMLKKNNPGRINKRRIQTLERLKNPKHTITEAADKGRVAVEIRILESRILAETEARGIRSKKDRGDKNNA